MDRRQALALAICAVGDVIDRHTDDEGSNEWKWARVTLRDMLADARNGKELKMPIQPMPDEIKGDKAREAYKILAAATIPPTVRELAAAAGYQSHSKLHGQLCKWRAAGLVTWEEGKVRTLRVVC